MPSTPLRNVRVPDDVWLPAKARARYERVPLASVIVGALRDYGSGFADVPGASEGARITAEIDSDPAEAARLRESRRQAREGGTVRWDPEEVPEVAFIPPPPAKACRHPAALVADNICGACGVSEQACGLKGLGDE